MHCAYKHAVFSNFEGFNLKWSDDEERLRVCVECPDTFVYRFIHLGGALHHSYSGVNLAKCATCISHFISKRQKEEGKII